MSDDTTDSKIVNVGVSLSTLSDESVTVWEQELDPRPPANVLVSGAGKSVVTENSGTVVVPSTPVTTDDPKLVDTVEQEVLNTGVGKPVEVGATRFVDWAAVEPMDWAADVAPDKQEVEDSEATSGMLVGGKVVPKEVDAELVRSVVEQL